ncbi:MAG: HEAT repeat domain-containing protein [Planctomycetota bacterium]
MEAIKSHIATLDDSSDVAAQVAAAETLSSLAEAAQPAIVSLVKHSGSDNEDLCNWCTSALESIGPPAAGQIEELATLVSSANANVAFWAITLLGRAGNAAGSAKPALVARSEDDSLPEVQQRASWALGKLNTD